MHPRVVLVADMDPHTCLLISNLLRSEGYRVVTAPARLAGLQTMGLLHLDILLLGISKASTTGAEALRTLHARYPETPTVWLSAPNNGSDERESPGADRFLAKPIDPAALIAVVRELAPT
jgi:CheY-like chemotaxis protein